ncbi:MAG TPA: PAS domain S-box protein, partial [Desulfonatronum sp.]|nr:PAS domain S-box protein [Desulfonatronum sp.]
METSMPEPTPSRIHSDPAAGFDLQDIFDNAPIGIFTSTPEGTFLSVNPAMAEIFGYDSPQEMIASVTDIAAQLYADPKDRQEFALLLEEHGQVVNHECRMLLRDGTGCWVSRNAHAVKDANGRTVAYQGFATNITERKSAEEKIRDSEQNYQELVENINDVIFRIDLDGRITYLNPSARNIGGEMVDALMHHDFRELVDPRDLHLVQKAWENILQGRLQANEYRLRLKPGETIWVRTSSRPVFKDGSVAGIVGILTDITDRKKTEEALQQSQELLKAIVDKAQDSIFVKDAALCYIKVNTAMESLFGMSAGDILGKSDFDLFGAEFAKHIEEKDREVLDGNIIEEHISKPVNGEQRHFHTIKVPLKDSHGTIVGLCGTARDITKIKRAEEALRNEAVWRRILIDQSRDGIVVLREDGSVHEANKRYAEMLGYASEEVLQLHVWDWDTQWPRETLLEMIRQVDAEGEHFETRHRRKDGTLYDVEISTNGAVFDGRKLVFCVCRDITERKQAEYEKTRSREMLLQAEILANLGCLEWDIPNDIWFVSDNWRCIMGHSSPRLSSTELFAYVHPEDRWRVKRAIVTTMRTGEPYDIQHRILRGDTGDVRYIQSYGVVELNKSGEPVRGFGAIQDNTERKQAEEALRESETRFRDLLEQVPSVAVQGYGMDGVTHYWNRASEMLYGYRSNEVIRKNLVDLIIPDELRQSVVQAIRKMSESGVPIPAGELNLKRKDGSLVTVYSSHAIVHKPGTSPELFSMDIDLTKLKQAEQALLQAKEAAEAANKAKSEFLANMSHEIRTPINGIMGMMQLLETTTLDADQRQYVQLCTSSANRLTRLLSDILDLSRVEAGKMTIHEAEFMFRELGDSVTGLFTFNARSKGVVLECGIDPAIPSTLIGDEARVRQILFNLAGNALKFTDKGSVRVAMTPAACNEDGVFKVLFTISDTGIGIPEDKLQHLFSPFFQVEASYTRSIQGAGLGLAIVKRLVDLMGGSISVDSSVGQGTTVHVVLPFKLPAGASIPDQQGSKRLTEARQKLRILLAEDDPSNALPIRLLLEQAGHAVTLAEDGQQALDLFQ